MSGRDFDLGEMQISGSFGMDALFERQPELVKAPKRIRVASLKQLEGFERTSADTLVHTSERDLWALRREADGSHYIERLFDDHGAPLKG